MSQQPHSDFANLRSTVERIARHATDPEVRRLVEQLGSELERAINRVNNTAGVVIGNVELGLSNRLDTLATELHTFRERFEAHDRQEFDERQQLSSQIAELEQMVGQVLGLLRDEAASDA